MNEQWLRDAEASLTRLVANIFQISHKDSSRFASAVVAKASGAAGAAGVLGLVGAFGSASTGTAIASLSGAAASSATLYWIGSLIGGGVFAGTVLTGGIGVLVGYTGLRLWKGKPRKAEDLTDEEKGIVNACLALVKAFKEQLGAGTSIPKEHACIVLEKAWVPLVNSVAEYNKTRAVKTLNTKNFFALGNRALELRALAGRLEQWVKLSICGCLRPVICGQMRPLGCDVF